VGDYVRMMDICVKSMKWEFTHSRKLAMRNLTPRVVEQFFPLSLQNSAARAGKWLALFFATFSSLFCLLAGISAQTEEIAAISVEFSRFLSGISH
jgi:hypothetical protein